MTKQYKKEEFDCKDGSEMPEEVYNNVKKLAINLELIRAFFNAPIKINSGYRSPNYNKKVGGAKNSQHLKGKAADIVVKGFTPKQVADAIEGLIRVGVISEGGVGRYETFVHYDIRGEKARWNG